MKRYGRHITLSKNGRGIWDIDPIKGCYYGTRDHSKGCYGDCYAARSANQYGYDFSKSVLRSFKSKKHLASIQRQIEKIDMPFIRMGNAGDPSENWTHTLDICKSIQCINQLTIWPIKRKEIVIITKHWNNLTDSQAHQLNELNVTINTSISVMDDDLNLHNSIVQYQRLKEYCKSILRVVSCDFNIENTEGRRLYKRQERLFKKYRMLDTVFRPTIKNKYVLDGIINTERKKFNGKLQLVSKYNKKAYLGGCARCPDMCGLTL